MVTLPSDATVLRETTEAVDQAIRSIQGNPHFLVINGLPPTELRKWCEQVVNAITMWAAGQEFAPVMHAFTVLGREGQHHGVPGQELVHALALVIDACKGVPHIAGMEPGTLPDARRLRPFDTFMDFAKYYLIRGYEESSR
jgi:hypothetical protein